MVSSTAGVRRISVDAAMSTRRQSTAFWTVLAGFQLILQVNAQNEEEESTEDNPSDGLLIFAYVCFALGAILIVIGFARLIWWAWMIKKNGSRRRNLSNPNFYTYYKDPWLRAPSMASLASGSRIKSLGNDPDTDSLRVDTDAIYAQPVDVTTNVTYPRCSPQTDHELSQTESQIYAETGNGRGLRDVSSAAPRGGAGGVASIDEQPEAAPELPARMYGSLAEADRASMREISYVEPPADYSPSGRRSSSSRDRRSGHEEPLSGRQLLYQTAVFRDNSGSEVSRIRVVAPPSGSVKSMKSLYQYMETQEPCALEDEINYTFVSSFH